VKPVLDTSVLLGPSPEPIDGAPAISSASASGPALLQRG
jgi:hypothetical protein